MRKITKPKQAIPIHGYLEPLAKNSPRFEGHYFRADEVSQIAIAYAKAVLAMKKIRKVDISANQEPYPDEAWQFKFKEWDSK